MISSVTAPAEQCPAAQGAAGGPCASCRLDPGAPRAPACTTPAAEVQSLKSKVVSAEVEGRLRIEELSAQLDAERKARQDAEARLGAHVATLASSAAKHASALMSVRSWLLGLAAAAEASTGPTSPLPAASPARSSMLKRQLDSAEKLTKLAVVALDRSASKSPAKRPRDQGAPLAKDARDRIRKLRAVPTAASVDAVVTLMQARPDTVTVQEEGCRTLDAYVKSGSPMDVVVLRHPGVAHVLTNCMVALVAQPTLLEAAGSLLCSLSFVDDGDAGDAGGRAANCGAWLQFAFHIMANCGMNPRLAEYAAAAVLNLLSNPATAAAAGDAMPPDAAERLAHMAGVFCDVDPVVRCCLAALAALVETPRHRAALAAGGGLAVVIRALDAWHADADIVCSGCHVLRQAAPFSADAAAALQRAESLA